MSAIGDMVAAIARDVDALVDIGISDEDIHGLRRDLLLVSALMEETAAVLERMARKVALLRAAATRLQ